MYILFIDDWLLCIVIASVVQWSVLSLTHWRPRLNFCGKHNIFNFKRNAIMSYITTDMFKLKISVGSGESCELTPWRPRFKSGWCLTLLFFIGRHEKKHRGQHCCFLLVTMKKNIRGNTVVFYWSSWKKT